MVAQALQEMRKLRTEKTAEVKEFKLRLEHLKTHKDHSTKLKSDIAEGQEKDRNYMTQINQFQQEVQVSCDLPVSLSLIEVWGGGGGGGGRGSLVPPLFQVLT